MDRPAKQESQSKSIFEKLRDKKTAAVLATGIGISALAGCSTPTNAEPQPSHSVSVEETPAETPEATPSATPETEESLEARIEALRIPEGLNDEELAEAFIKVSNEWWVAGASEELRMGRLNANLTWEEYLPQIAAENAKLYAPALFGDDWESSEEIREEVQGNIDGNLNYLLNYVATAWNTENPENKEAYVSWMTVNKVTNVTSSDTERTLKITYDNHNNADMNSVPDDALRASGAVEPVFTNNGGHVIVTSIDRQ